MPEHNYWFEAIGLVGACLTTFSFLPQALRIWRSRSARDVSLVMYVMMTSGTVMWLIYGFLLGSPALIRTHVWPAKLQQNRDIIVVVVCHADLVEPPIGITAVTDAQQRVDQLRPVPDPAFEVARHVKGEAEIDGSQPPSTDQVIGTKEPGRRVLPFGNEASNDGFELRIPNVIPRTPP